jgi:hypothetical protein
MKKYAILTVVLLTAILALFPGCSTPQSNNLINGNIVVTPGDYYDIPFLVDTNEMQNVRVVGYFAASGGSGNDIEVAILDDMAFINWINGHEVNSLYSSGKITVAEIDVSITTSGKYHLVFHNLFSIISSKNVYANVDLNWSG